MLADSSTQNRPMTLGVAGGTGSGKTTVARSLLEQVGPDRLAFLPQDMYYRNAEDLADGSPEEVNFDHPSTIDTPLLAEHLRELRSGRAVDRPVYDFVQHRRCDETVRVEPEPVILVEGILLLAEPEIRDLLDLKIFVDTDADVRLARRIRRDIRERGRSIDEVLHRYLTTVRPMHLEFVEPSKRWADIIVPEGGRNRVAMGMVTAKIEKLLGQGS